MASLAIAAAAVNTVTADADFARLAQVLERRAADLAEAAGEAARLRQKTPELAWRRAGLIWPLFTKG